MKSHYVLMETNPNGKRVPRPYIGEGNNTVSFYFTSDIESARQFKTKKHAIAFARTEVLYLFDIELRLVKITEVGRITNGKELTK